MTTPAKPIILVPVDFQEPSRRALAMASEYARRMEMDIVLVHVFVIPAVVYPGFDPIVAPGMSEEIATAARTAAEQIAQSVSAARTILRSGDPATEILKVIDEQKPALVVMGTHGRQGLSHFFLGSVAEKVVRQSAAPVLTVRTHEG